jgi:crossover junction endodeoxyribonuclease RuvC
LTPQGASSTHSRKPLIILGVDPGTLVTGYGVLEGNADSVRVLEYDVVKNRSDRSLPLRLRSIYETLCRVIDRTHPDEFAIETAFYGKNAQSALKIGHARGVSILAAVTKEIPTAEYSPREIKKAVVGNGAASKEQVQLSVRKLLRLKETPALFDATDALAVALCHLQRRQGIGMPDRTSARRRKASAGWEAFVKANPHRVARNA